MDANKGAWNEGSRARESFSHAFNDMGGDDLQIPLQKEQCFMERAVQPYNDVVHRHGCVTVGPANHVCHFNIRSTIHTVHEAMEEPKQGRLQSIQKTWFKRMGKSDWSAKSDAHYCGPHGYGSIHWRGTTECQQRESHGSRKGSLKG